MATGIDDPYRFFGLEFDWFAIDEEGSLGLFSTGGYGEIPVDVLNHSDCHKDAASSIPLPHWGTKMVWEDFAQSGLYVFDWQPHQGPYMKVAVPIMSMNIALQQQVFQIPNIPRLKISFRVANQVKIERYNP